MSQSNFTINIEDVVNLCGLERDPHSRQGATSFNVRCPFCGDRKYHMNINTDKNTYRCILCSGNDTGTGTLDLYSRIRYGTRAVKGENTRKLFIDLKNEMQGVNPAFTTNIRKPDTEPSEIYPASTDILNATYTELLSLPYFALKPEHVSNLISRGLTPQDITRNGYASFVPGAAILADHPKAKAIKAEYQCKALGQYKSDNYLLKRYTDDDLIAGIAVARDIIRKGLNVKGVPGFFKLGNEWCFKWEIGIAIPTRNIEGKIVGIQTRRDVKTEQGLRYMTLSSKGLPEGVTTQISRTHFPVSNAKKINPDTAVILTEGPLKADVSLCLLNSSKVKNCYFIALQGVNNYREIPEIADALQKQGVKRVYNAFDMDKVTNPWVAKAGRSIRDIFTERGINFPSLLWDTEHAKDIESRLMPVMSKYHIDWKSSSNSHVNIANMIQAISFSTSSGSSILEHEGISTKWPGDDKGIDDRLFSLQKSR